MSLRAERSKSCYVLVDDKWAGMKVTRVCFATPAPLNDTSNPSVRKGGICHCEAVRPWQSPKLWQIASLRSQ